jgi:DNA-binding NarL/FixJ family response regulator
MPTSAALEVLLVEDSETDAKLIVLELRRSGFAPNWERVETESALREALTRRRWEVVISDSSMPGLSMLQALALTKEAVPGLPFIVLSGTMTEELAVRALQSGARDYVVKTRMERLGPAVAREVARSSSGAAVSGLPALLAELKINVERAQRCRGAARAMALAEAASLVERAIVHAHDLSTETATASAAPGGSTPTLTPRQREILRFIAEGLSTKQIAARLEISAKTVETHRSQLMDRLNIHHVAGLVHYALRAGLVPHAE